MDLVDSFLAEVSSEQTRRAYGTDLDRFFQEELVNESVVQSTEAENVQSFLRAMHRRELSASTQRRRLAALRRFFDWLIQEDVVSHNPARMPRVQLPRADAASAGDATLSKKEVEALVATAAESPTSGLRDQALILTIVYAALRRGEVAALEVENVRPLGRYWVLDLKDSAQGGGYVRIPGAVVEAIERMKDAYDITSGPLWRSVSNQNHGCRMTPDAIYKVVRRVSEQAGLDSVSIDALRRTGLQLALAGGADVPQVQAHGRFGDSASAARLQDVEERSGALDESAVEHIDLDLSVLSLNA